MSMAAYSHIEQGDSYPSLILINHIFFNREIVSRALVNDCRRRAVLGQTNRGMTLPGQKSRETPA